MLENSFGLTFFLKKSTKKNEKYVYLRITVDGIPKEVSTKHKWSPERWNQKTERAVGIKEDAKTLNFYIETLQVKIQQFKNDLILNDETITSQKIMDFVRGKSLSTAKLLEEFQKHNDEILALVPKEYAKGTHERFVTARSHVEDFIRFKYNLADVEFRELNYEFVKDYEFYLKTVRHISNNTTLKYISNLKKIILRAIARDIIPSDPFKLFKGRKTKTNKKPLTKQDLEKIENYEFATPRLAEVRDIFIFQCYTGLAYIDAFNLKKTDVKKGFDGELWIMTARQKTDSETNVPLLPKALEIMDRYSIHPICIERGSVLPVKSNQKMNAYLKEIAGLTGIECELNTHKARRTFASTITLANNVPIHVVKEMLGHHSVQQTEEYAITEQQSVGREMKQLQQRLSSKKTEDSNESVIAKMQQEINELKVLLTNNQKASLN